MASKAGQHRTPEGWRRQSIGRRSAPAPPRSVARRAAVWRDPDGYGEQPGPVRLARPRSSVGQSKGLLIPRSQVRILPGAPRGPFGRGADRGGYARYSRRSAWARRSSDRWAATSARASRSCATSRRASTRRARSTITSASGRSSTRSISASAGWTTGSSKRTTLFYPFLILPGTDSACLLRWRHGPRDSSVGLRSCAVPPRQRRPCGPVPTRWRRHR
jgi:hypothetical protein